jgi:hypothetical protein
MWDATRRRGNAKVLPTEGGKAACEDVACHIHANKVSRYDSARCPS